MSEIWNLDNVYWANYLKHELSEHEKEWRIGAFDIRWTNENRLRLHLLTALLDIDARLQALEAKLR